MRHPRGAAHLGALRFAEIPHIGLSAGADPDPAGIAACMQRAGKLRAVADPCRAGARATAAGATPPVRENDSGDEAGTAFRRHATAPQRRLRQRRPGQEDERIAVTSAGRQKGHPHTCAGNRHMQGRDRRRRGSEHRMRTRQRCVRSRHQRVAGLWPAQQGAEMIVWFSFHSAIPGDCRGESR